MRCRQSVPGVGKPPPRPPAEEVLYYHRDRLFNIVGLSLGNTPGVRDYYHYTPYGDRVTLRGNDLTPEAFEGTYGNLRGFQGLRHDEETGLIYNRARMLDPQTGRFLQRDPLGYPDGLNTRAIASK